MIYLLDVRGHHVGPFRNRECVERFINMMALCGEDWAESRILDGGEDVAPGPNPAQMIPCTCRLKTVNRLRLAGRGH